MVSTAQEGASAITPGVILDGKYEVLRVLGAGAVGIVYEAVNVELDEKVAIKCLLPDMLAEPAMVARFAREAKSAAAMKCEYVATVYDVGIHDDGSPFIVMEYLEGRDLETLLSDDGRIKPRVAVEYTLQICEALAVAHSKGIVHRDLKPANLLVTERVGGMRIVKVLDFGISKAALTGSIFGEELPVVKTQNLMGTPLYMSPEQVRCSDKVDERSDIWSLGLVLYEMLTGETPFTGVAITEVCASILESRPKPLGSHRNDIPPGLLTVLEKCLEKDPARRYQTVAELAIDLLPFAPKRSRLNVERAIAVLQSAGKLDPSVQLQSSAPGSTAEAAQASRRVFPSPRVPALETLTSGSTPPRAATTSAPEQTDQPPAPKRRAIVIAVGAAVLALVAILVAMPRSGASGSTSPPASAPSATAAPERDPGDVHATAPLANTPATSASIAEAAPEQAPTATANPVANPMRGAAPARALSGARPPAKSKPAVSSSSKPNQEPDLGY